MSIGYVDKLRFVVLCDNYVNTPIEVFGEWGFSCLIEVEKSGFKQYILYDVGLSGETLLHNANCLGIDLSRVNYVVLSHGHSDHTGGLKCSDVLSKLRGKILIAHPNILDKKFSLSGKTLRFIGLPIGRDVLESNFNVVYCREPLEFLDGVVFSGEIPRFGFKEFTEGLFRLSDVGVEPDKLLDDTALIINVKGRGLVLFVGCGHSGILNIVKYVVDKFSLDVYAIIGGLHLFRSSFDVVKEVIDKLVNEFKVKLICPLHCSGYMVKSYLSLNYSDKFIDGGVGLTMTI